MPVYERYDATTTYVAISDADRHPAPALRGDRSTTASTSTRSPSTPHPGEHLLFFGRIHPDKGTAHAIEVARRSGRRLVIAGIIQDERYFRDEVEPHLDGESRPLPRSRRRRRPRRRCSARPTPCCT